jgi:hypothetical protein
VSFKYFILDVNETKDSLHNMDLLNIDPTIHEKSLVSTNMKKLYKWDDLKFSENMKPLREVQENEMYFCVNYKGSTLARIIENKISFMDDDFNILFEMDDLKSLFDYKPIDGSCCEDYRNSVNNGNLTSFSVINDNCLFYYETCDLLDCRNWIYCNGFPFREDGKVKLLMYEYYSCGISTQYMNKITNLYILKS